MQKAHAGKPRPLSAMSFKFLECNKSGCDLVRSLSSKALGVKTYVASIQHSIDLIDFTSERGMSQARILCQKTLGLQHQEDYTTKESNQRTVHQCNHGNASRHVQCEWKQWTVSNTTCKWNCCSLFRARAWWIKLLLAARADIKLFWMPDHAASNLFKQSRSSHEDEPCALNAPRYLWSIERGLEVSRTGFKADNIRLTFSVILVLLSR